MIFHIGPLDLSEQINHMELFMHKTIKQAAAVIAMSVFAAGASAGNGDAYFGVGYHMGIVSFPATDYKPSALNIKIGKYFTDNVAIEGRFLTSLSGDKQTFSTGSGDVNVETNVSGSFFVVKGDMPISNNANLYGVIGFGSHKIEQKLTGALVGTGSESNSGAVYGVGVESLFGDSVGIYVEYMDYPNGSNYDNSGVNLGITKKF